MPKSHVGAFYVGVLKAPSTTAKATALIADSIRQVTIGRVSAGATAKFETRLGGAGYPTSVSDRNIHVETLDTHLVGEESSSAEVIKKAQELFADPDGYAKAHKDELDPMYLKALKDFKSRVSHCVVQLIGLHTP
jgi:hypothetical protein